MLGIFAILLARSSGVGLAPAPLPSRVLNGGGHQQPLAPAPPPAAANPVRLNGGHLSVVPRARGAPRCRGPAGLGGAQTLVRVAKARAPLTLVAPAPAIIFDSFGPSTAVADSSGTVATLTVLGSFTSTASADSSGTVATLTVLASFSSTALAVSSTAATFTVLASFGSTALAVSSTAAILTSVVNFAASTAVAVSSTTATVTVLAAFTSVALCISSAITGTAIAPTTATGLAVNFAYMGNSPSVAFAVSAATGGLAPIGGGSTTISLGNPSLAVAVSSTVSTLYVKHALSIRSAAVAVSSTTASNWGIVHAPPPPAVEPGSGLPITIQIANWNLFH